MNPITIYNPPKDTGPNPWKPIFVAEELSLPYEIVWIPYGDINSEPYLSLNPNGRVPAMVDPNTNVTLWESGAVMEYLIDTYDKELKLSYGEDRLEDKWQVHSWLMFQMSGQGPTFGQKTWFTYFHGEKNLATAIERYGNEGKRIVGVIDSHLRKQKQKLGLADNQEVWLVGDKCTFADLSFVSWNLLLYATVYPEGFDVEKEYPIFYKWSHDVFKRPAVDKVVQIREEAMRTMEDGTNAVLERQKDSRSMEKLPY